MSTHLEKASWNFEHSKVVLRRVPLINDLVQIFSDIFSSARIPWGTFMTKVKEISIENEL